MFDSYINMEYFAAGNYNGIEFSVKSNTCDLIEYLSKFLSPYFKFEQHNLNKELFELNCILLENVTEISPLNFKNSILMKDSHNDDLKFWGEETTIGLDRVIRISNTYIKFQKESNKIFLYSNVLEEIKKYSTLVIRDIVKKEFEQKGGITFHASSIICKDGKSIAIIGNKGCGKTTMLMEYLSQMNYSMQALDRLMISIEDKKIFTIGWPMCLNIGIGMLNKYKELKRFIPDEYKARTDLREIEKKILIQPYDLPYSIEIKGLLKYIIFPKKSKSDKSYIRKVSFSEYKNIIFRNCYTPIDEAFLNWHKFITYDEEMIQQRIEETLPLIFNEIPCYELNWGKRIILPD